MLKPEQRRKSPIILLDDIDGTERYTKPWVFPAITVGRLVRRDNLTLTPTQLREKIELGGRTHIETPHEDCDSGWAVISRLRSIRSHDDRPLMPFVRESIESIRTAVEDRGRDFAFGNLTGREPHLHEITQEQQIAELLCSPTGDQLELNPGVGSLNWKLNRIFCYLIGQDRWRNTVSRPHTVVTREDDLAVAVATAALNRLPEVKEAGTQVLAYWKRPWCNPDALLWWAGVKLNQSIVPFDDHMSMAFDLIEKLDKGLI